jgi:deoxyribodipyrimidine photo-lyase
VGEVAVVWFRRDLRVHDHPALTAAVAAGLVVPLFVADEVLLAGHRSCARRTGRMWAAVAALRAELAARGSRLVVRTGDPPSVVARVARELGAAEVHVTADHTPYARRRDTAVKRALAEVGGRLVEHPGLLVHEAGSIVTGSGHPYAVFGPFHRRWLATPMRQSLPAPARIISPDALSTAPAGGRGADIAGSASPAAPSGEADAQHQLEAFLARLPTYAADRDRLDREATSRLSADLHFGTLSSVVLAERVAATAWPGADRYLAELAWRDLYAHRMVAEAADGVVDRDPVAWRHDPAAFAVWAVGRTGYPAVDAGMRQLAAEGWLSNRARMIVASFLVKDLLIDWRLGAEHFLRHLEDGDVASNTGNWRWVAGVGPGAAPWFRIFDPVAQGRRHDPDGRWIRRWLPELRELPGSDVHEPWHASRPPTDYPPRVVDHAVARRRALDAARAARLGR